MSAALTETSILVASDNTDDAAQIVKHLRSEFKNVHASTNADRSVQEFEEIRPEVLVLAFDTLDKAQRYYLGLYRRGQQVPQNPHRTVILCDRDELAAVVDLCKREYFDDYVLHWPLSHDGARLGMSIRIASREMKASHASNPRPAGLLAHARHLEELDRALGCDLDDAGRNAEDARRAAASAEREIAFAIDEFSNRLASGPASAGVDVTNPEQLARELGELRERQIGAARRSGTMAVDSIHAHALQLKERIGPALAGTRAFAQEVRKVRPVVMVVEDDEFARQLVKRTLDPLVWEVIFANNGAEALGQLRRLRPDIILMDICMPGMDGVSLTHRLKASPHLAAIPVIIMTGDARKETLASSVAAGAAAFVVKPFTRELLTAKLEKVLPG
jgi:CheY-like chemotaxis protein